MARSRRNRRKGKKLELPKLPQLKLSKLPRPAINWRVVLALPLVLAAVAMIAVIGRELLDVRVRTLEIDGSFQRVTEIEIAAAVSPFLERGFFELDLDGIKRQVAQIEWVDWVRVQRVWPDTLRISYSEHRAAASWGDTGLLNTRGELFAENVWHEYQELPKLKGPDGSHQRVAEVYLEVKEQLADANLLLESIEMDARGAFQIALAAGPHVHFGRDDVASRIDRFFSVALPELKPRLARVDYIDMRYPNGFAVGWHSPAPTSRDPDGVSTSG
jgi:cell division protein FtsQ